MTHLDILNAMQDIRHNKTIHSLFICISTALLISPTALAKPVQLPPLMQLPIESNIMFLLDVSESMESSNGVDDWPERTDGSGNALYKQTRLGLLRWAIDTLLTKIDDSKVRLCVSTFPDKSASMVNRTPLNFRQSGGAKIQTHCKVNAGPEISNIISATHADGIKTDIKAGPDYNFYGEVAISNHPAYQVPENDEHPRYITPHTANDDLHLTSPMASALYDITRYFRKKSAYFGTFPAPTNHPITHRCQANTVVLITDGDPHTDWTMPTNLPPTADDALIKESRTIDGIDYSFKSASGTFNATHWKPNDDDTFYDDKGNSVDIKKYYIDDVTKFSSQIDLVPTSTSSEPAGTAFVDNEDEAGVSFDDPDFTQQKLTTHIIGISSGLDGAAMTAAATDGGGTYIVATDANSLVNALETIVSTSISPRVSGAGGTQSTVVLDSDGKTKIYISEFNGDDWTGDLFKLTLKENPSNNTIEFDTATSSYWAASTFLNNTDAHTSRKIFTSAKDTNGDPQLFTTTLTEETKLAIVSFNNNYTNFLEAKRQDFEISFLVGYEVTNPLGTADPNYLVDLSAAWTAQQMAVDYPQTFSNDKQGAVEAAEDIVNYIRGDNSKESAVAATGQFRKRTSNIGDFINSPAAYVKNFHYGYLDSSLEDRDYTNYVNSQKARQTMVYIGGNDGMLHAINESTGKESYAFIPQALLPQLPNLASPSYLENHQLFVDGSLTVSDAKIGTETETDTWRTLLASPLGAGYRGLFLLDITDPPTAAIDPSDILKWEVNEKTTGYEALGYNINNGKIVRTINDDDEINWYYIIGNGVHSEDAADQDPQGNTVIGKALVYIINLSDGTMAQGSPVVLDNGRLDQASNGLRAYETFEQGNGATSVAALDVDGDTYVDRLYAADLKGNIWRLKYNTTSGEFENEFKGEQQDRPIFIAKNIDGGTEQRQAITSEIIITSPPGDARDYGSEMLFFGTGQLFDKTHINATETGKVQSMYAFIDHGNWEPASSVTSQSSDSISRDNLVEQIIDPTTGNTRSFTNAFVDYSQNLGWFIDLPGSGERIITQPVNLFDHVAFTTQIISGVESRDPCIPVQHETWVMTAQKQYGTAVKDSSGNSQSAGNKIIGELVSSPFFVRLSNGQVVSLVVDVSAVSDNDGLPNLSKAELSEPLGRMNTVYSSSSKKRIN